MFRRNEHMQLIEGRKIAEDILSQVKEGIKRNNLKPGLGVILIGDDAASSIYVGLKEKAAQKVGINFSRAEFAANASESDIIEKIKEFNINENIDGIIVQLPLPEKFDTEKIIGTINPEKDVDGFCPENIEKFLRGEKNIDPVFPKAIIKMLKSTREELIGKKTMAVVNSEIFGKVMKKSLENEEMKAEYILTKEFENNPDKIREADILITAAGVSGMITDDVVKEGVIIIDGGITKQEGAVLGDVDRRLIEKKAKFVSPVPGGVGPVTVACLLENVFLFSIKKISE